MRRRVGHSLRARQRHAPSAHEFGPVRAKIDDVRLFAVLARLAKQALAHRNQRRLDAMVGLALSALRLKPLAFDDDVSVLPMTRQRDIKLARVGLLGDINDARRCCSPLRRVNRSGVGVNDPGRQRLPARTLSRKFAPIAFDTAPVLKREGNPRVAVWVSSNAFDRGAIAVADAKPRQAFAESNLVARSQSERDAFVLAIQSGRNSMSWAAIKPSARSASRADRFQVALS